MERQTVKTNIYMIVSLTMKWNQFDQRCEIGQPAGDEERNTYLSTLILMKKQMAQDCTNSTSVVVQICSHN